MQVLPHIANIQSATPIIIFPWICNKVFPLNQYLTIYKKLAKIDYFWTSDQIISWLKSLKYE